MPAPAPAPRPRPPPTPQSKAHCTVILSPSVVVMRLARLQIIQKDYSLDLDRDACNFSEFSVHCQNLR